MSLRFLNKNECPPGTFRLWVKETGIWIDGIDWNQFSGRVKAHFQANSIPIGLLFDDWLEDQACQNTAPECCVREGYGNTVPLRSPTTFQQFKVGTLTLVEWYKMDRKKVPIEEANRRGAICVSCPINQTALDCPTCAKDSILNIVNQIVDGTPTTHDARLHACRICGCSLKAKVHLPLEVIRKHEPQFVTDQYPEFCWLRPPDSSFTP